VPPPERCQQERRVGRGLLREEIDEAQRIDAGQQTAAPDAQVAKEQDPHAQRRQCPLERIEVRPPEQYVHVDPRRRKQDCCEQSDTLVHQLAGEQEDKRTDAQMHPPQAEIVGERMQTDQVVQPPELQRL
jgi:hypothetical protein